MSRTDDYARRLYGDETADERNEREAKQLGRSLLRTLETAKKYRLKLGWADNKHGRNVPASVREALRECFDVGDLEWYLKDWLEDGADDES